MQLKTLGALMVAGCALCGLGGKASAQDYPNRTVKMLIAFSPAGAIDVLGRHIADKLSTMWGQQVIVENRPGAGGNIGAAAAAQAAPDGYTLHFGAQTLGTNVTLAPSTAFHPVASFEPIMLVSTALEVFMVANDTPFKSVKEVVDYAKANPGKLNYASVGIGSSAHLATVLFSEVTGVRMQHVPYSQMSQAYADLFSGRTELWFTTAGGSLPHIRAGKLRALAVNGPARSKLLPELPTMIELGINMKDEFELVRLLRAQGHATGHHRQGQSRPADRDRHARYAGEGAVARLSFRRGLARATGDLSQRRDREVAGTPQERRVQVAAGRAGSDSVTVCGWRGAGGENVQIGCAGGKRRMKASPGSSSRRWSHWTPRISAHSCRISMRATRSGAPRSLSSVRKYYQSSQQEGANS